MFSVGTFYALSVLQVQLPRLVGTSDAWSFAPFGVVCLGLTVGVATCASMIAQRGAQVTAASGTTLWGFAVIGAGVSLTRLRFESMLLCFLFGGVGVGWTYLAVVVMVGQGFPHFTLARSAIGPIGFSSGAATCFYLSCALQLSAVDADRVGQALTLAGGAFVAVGGATQLLMPGSTNNGQCNSPKTSLSRSERFFSILLFFNALPGMTVFGALAPLASYYADGKRGDDSMTLLLPYSMLALASGGVLAPTISAYLGARHAFVALLCLRGAFLVLLSQFDEESMLGLGAVVTILFAHGAGFSILPGLVKAQSTPPGLFLRSYGRVLVTWGVAGIVGCTVHTALSSSIGSISAASLVLGLFTSAFGILLHLMPSLGAEFLA
ncbi:hypothetical protein AbraIFM66950_002178 [Aspergillus brasiliensis]|nr:hypothetical protein AbraIFM66950_002178 [Aspergillus brasiliensis]